jgi:hypothetical protein
MKQTLLLLLICVLAHPVYSQIQVDSIFIYQDFNRAGTTAGLQYNHRELVSSGAQTVNLNEKETADLKELFSESKRKRYLQQKHGGEIYYAIVWFEGKKYNYIIEGSNSFARMINLNNMRKWTVNEPEKIKGLNDLLKEK